MTTAPQPSQPWFRDALAERAFNLGSRDMRDNAKQPDYGNPRQQQQAQAQQATTAHGMRPAIHPGGLGGSSGQLPGWQFGQIGEPAAPENGTADNGNKAHPLSPELPSRLGLWPNSGFRSSVGGTHQMW